MDIKIGSEQLLNDDTYFQMLQSCIKNYKPAEKAMITTAFEMADYLHRSQVRKSGEKFIIHPVHVACMLTQLHADADTVCAGLLHDVIEDTETTKKEHIASAFNDTVANLVDGVTKINKAEVNNDKHKASEATTRKIIESLTYDVRIIIIKLVDRLHNMRTLEYQNPDKQLKKAVETLYLYVPFAELLGEFEIKKELEDLCFKYINPNEYEEIRTDFKKILKEREQEVRQMTIELNQLLNTNGIVFDYNVKNKNLYSIFKKLNESGNSDIESLHNLVEFRYILENEDLCYLVRDHINRQFTPVMSRARDYIKDPKLNLYRAIHSTIISPGGYSMQVQLQTPKMYKINTHGVTAYWRLLGDEPGVAADYMLKELKKLKFIDVISELSETISDDEEFNIEVAECILNKRITVINKHKKEVFLPAGATVTDYIFKYCQFNAFNVASVYVNGIKVNYDTVLADKDYIDIRYKDELNTTDFTPYFATSHAKRLYKERLQGR